MQLPFIISRIKSAVVLPSSVTGLSSGTGGAFTVAHSAIMSAATDGDAVSNATASVPATAAAQQKEGQNLFHDILRWIVKGASPKLSSRQLDSDSTTEIFPVMLSSILPACAPA